MTAPSWQSRITDGAKAAGERRKNEKRRTMQCERCEERIELVLPSAVAFHASCRNKVRGTLPRYVPA